MNKPNKEQEFITELYMFSIFVIILGFFCIIANLLTISTCDVSGVYAGCIGVVCGLIGLFLDKIKKG